jgi:hypothetical protein
MKIEKKGEIKIWLVGNFDFYYESTKIILLHHKLKFFERIRIIKQFSILQFFSIQATQRNWEKPNRQPNSRKNFWSRWILFDKKSSNFDYFADDGVESA